MITFTLPRIAKILGLKFSALAALLLCVTAIAQTPTVITNPAVGVFTGGINLTAKIESAAIGGVVITVTKTSGTFGGSGVLRLCRGEGNVCETVLEAPYTSGATSVTLPAFTPRLRRQDFYYVQRYDAVTIGGLDANVRSAQMIVIADNAEAGRANAVQVTASIDSSCALTSSGSVRCWSQSALSPVAVTGLPTNVSKIAGTSRHVCAMASGQVYCWGSNFSGELGDGTTTARATAALVTSISGVVTDLFTGSSTTCALVGGTPWCWGSNQYGQATGGVSPNAPANAVTAAIVPSLGATVVQGTLGAGYGCVLRADSTVACWGVNNSGQLGNATGIGSNLVYPASAVSGMLAVQISTGTSSSVCATRLDTTIWCWGANGNGELGRGSISPTEPVPARASALASNALRISVGEAAACAITLGESVQCWGDNSYGQLGSGKRVDNVSTVRPVERTLMPEGVLNTAGSVRSVATGFQKMCLALADGSVRCSGHTSLGDASTNDSSTPASVVGFGSAQSTYAAPTLQTFARTGDSISLAFQDSIAPSLGPITQARWACRRVGQSPFTALGGQIDLNEAGGRQHTVQGYLIGPGPWECQVMFRTNAGYSAWSAWTTVTARPTAVPTMVSAVYDGSFGTLVFTDNIPASDGPIVGVSATCVVGSGTPQPTITAGCDATNTFCSASQLVSELSGSRHTIRIPLPAGISSVSCRASFSTNAGSAENAMAPFALTANPTSPPTINSGRLIGNTGTLSFSDNLPAAAGTVSTAAWQCTRIRDGAISSGGVTVNEPAGMTHTISLPLTSNDYQQNPDSYACAVKVATTGLAGPFSTAYIVGPNSPPVISGFSFSVTNGVISGSFSVADPDGDLVKNLMAYFGTSPRGTDCSSGVLGTWDVPRAGGTINFTASSANVGCSNLLAGATTIYGFVRASDASGRDAAIADAQAANTLWSPPTTSTYSLVFEQVPSTLAVNETTNVTVRLVDELGATATQFNGPIRVGIDVEAVPFAFEDEAGATASVSRVVRLKDGVGVVRALHFSEPAVVKLIAATTLNGTTLSLSSGIAGGLKSGPVTAQINLGGTSSAISVAKSASTTYKITWISNDSTAFNFFSKWCGGDFQAVLLNQNSAVVQTISPPSCALQAISSKFSVSGTIAPGAYQIEFRRNGIALARAISGIDTRKGNTTITYTAAQSSTNIDFTVANSVAGKRVVLLLHGIFGSSTSDDGVSNYTPKLPALPCSKQNGVWNQPACGSLLFFWDFYLGWQGLEARIKEAGYRVKRVAWDWRLSPEDAARLYLKPAVDAAYLESGLLPVDIVAHSMGGLVSLSAIRQLDSAQKVDRLLMLGSPLAGSLNAYGLLKVADPYGLDASILQSESAGQYCRNTIYSNAAEWLYENQTGSKLGTRTSNCDVTPTSVKYLQTVKLRRAIFSTAATGGLYLYPDFARLKFVASSPASWYGGQALQSYGPNNHLQGLASLAACSSDFSRRSGVSNGKTNVFLVLSNSSDKTLLSVPETRESDVSGNLMHSVWPKTGVIRGTGDGTVPVGGQRRKLADWLGIDLSTVESTCSLVGDYGKHADMTKNDPLRSWVKAKLGIAGPPVSTGNDFLKAASLGAPEYTMSFSQPTARVYWDVANVGRVGTDAADAAAETLDVNGAAASVSTNGDSLVLQLQKDAPGAVSAVFRLRDTSANILVTQASAVSNSTVSNQIFSNVFIARPNVVVSFVGSVDPSLPSVFFDMVGPKSPNNLRAIPSTNTTALSWLASTPSSDVTRYHVYSRRAQANNWRLDADVASTSLSTVLPFGGASSTVDEREILVVAVDAQGRYSYAQSFANNTFGLEPDFSFAMAKVAANTLATSASSSSIANAPLPFTISGGEYSLNGAAWSSVPGSLPPYASIQLRGTSPATVGNVQNVVLTSNGVPYTFAIQSVIPPFCRRATRGLVDVGPFVRYLDGLSDAPMISGFVPAAENTSANAANLANHYTDNLLAYDFNGDSSMSPEIDGLLYARYALGFRGAGLVAGIAVGTTLTTAQIEAALAACQ